MAKGTKTPSSANSERAIVKNLVHATINRLNNILISNNQSHRYKLEWNRGTGYIDNGYEKTKHYYKLECYIEESNGDIIPVYGDNQPIPNGMSELRILEAELQAYRNFLLHSVGSLISIQHGTFLQAELAEKQREQELANEPLIYAPDNNQIVKP